MALTVTGIGAGPLKPIMSTISQERVPAELRGEAPPHV